jgi:hypothetical protein
MVAGVLLAWMAAPRAAHASCGNHATVLPRTDGLSASETGTAFPDLLSDLLRHPAPLPQAPCQGPGCSEGHPPLLPAPSTAPTLDDDRWGQGFLARLVADTESDLLPLSLTPARPVRGGCSIFHPPR